MQLIFSNCFHRKRPLCELKLVKRGKTSIFIVKDSQKLKSSFWLNTTKRNTALLHYTLKKLPIRTFLMHPMNWNRSKNITAFIYQAKQKRTLISHPFRGVLGLIPFPQAINQSINSYFYVLLDNAFKVEQKVKYKSDLGITGWCVQWNISWCAVAKGTVFLKLPLWSKTGFLGHQICFRLWQGMRLSNSAYTVI